MAVTLSSFRIATGALRMLPEYLIIGAQKCGTSSLYRYLVAHPSAAAAARKEVHFFDWEFRRGTDWYRAHFPLAALGVAFRSFTGRRLVVGEASPYYLFHPHAPARVKALLPNVKLIVLLRDPVARTLSAYQHQVRRGREPLSFEDALAQEGERLEPEIARLACDPDYKSVVHRNLAYKARGVYADQISRWLDVFPREQLLVIRSEDFFEDTTATLTQVLDYLDLPHWTPPGYRRFNAAEYDEMAPVTRRHLIEYFAPRNQRLYDLLGRDFGWPR
jgi:hypothetical protein